LHDLSQPARASQPPPPRPGIFGGARDASAARRYVTDLAMRNIQNALFIATIAVGEPPQFINVRGELPGRALR
jgi:hypothetical protein